MENTDKYRKKAKRIDITFNGETKSLNRWAEDIGIRYTTLVLRLKSGLTFEEAIVKPTKSKTKICKTSGCGKLHRCNGFCMSCDMKDKYQKRKEQGLSNPDVERYKKLPKNEQIFWRTLHRAKKLNIPFNLEPSDIIIPEYCPVLGIKLTSHSGKGGYKDDSPSIDKIVPELGYVKGNIKIISYRANKIKIDSTEEELENLLNYVKTEKQRMKMEGLI